MHKTDQIKLGNIGLNPDGAFTTTQVRMAYEFLNELEIIG